MGRTSVVQILKSKIFNEDEPFEDTQKTANTPHSVEHSPSQ